MRLIDEQPRTGIRNSRVAFLHPSSTGGVLTEIVQPAERSLTKSMPSNDKPQKVNIGFNGGQVLSARVAPDELSKLRSALGGDGWHELTAEDGTVALSLGSIVYVLVDHEEHRVGFGS